MKCNPLRWLWGLLPLTLLWWFGLLGMQQRIQDELAERTRAHLANSGLPWASATFRGRDASIIGRAEDDSDKARPAIEVAKVWGVRIFEDKVDVLQLIRDYRWNAATRDGVLSLTGYVPNEAARKSILVSAKSSFPSHKVEDKMELARGAPDQKAWLGGTAFALKELAALKPGGRASLEAAGLVIEGEAATSRAYEGVRTALTRQMPQGISLKSERVIPPVVKPYTWSAALRGKQIELTGHVPSVPARDHIKATAQRALAGATIVDRMTIASGAPADWQKVADVALTRLGQLKQGSAELVDRQLRVTGLTETEEAATRVRAGLKGDVPSAFQLTEQIQQDPVVKAAEEARRRAEEEARRRAEEEARRRAEEEARRRAEEARRKAEEEARARAAAEAEARRRAEAEAQRVAEARARAEEEARRAAEAKAKAEDEARRTAEARAKTEAERRTAEAKAKADEEARRTAEARAKADAERRAAEARAKAEEDARRAQTSAQARVIAAQRCQERLAAAVESGNITFQRASAELDRRSHQTLDQLAQIAKGCPGFTIEVGGHTDNEGAPDRNQRLSERRARSVLDYLVKVGVPADALTAAGYGETQPKVPNDSPANMARNRRIEFSVKSQ